MNTEYRALAQKSIDGQPQELDYLNQLIDEKIDNAVSQNPIGGNGFQYSYEEQWTGNYWVDGKKIYCKVIDCGNLPNNSAKYIPHNILNTSNWITIRGIVNTMNTERDIVPIIYAQNVLSSAISIGIRTTTNQIFIYTGMNRPETTVIAILEYTCTNR
jgi:hypothetical protein